MDMGTEMSHIHRNFLLRRLHPPSPRSRLRVDAMIVEIHAMVDLHPCVSIWKRDHGTLVSGISLGVKGGALRRIGCHCVERLCCFLVERLAGIFAGKPTRGI
jgi:hypothetical protein